MAEPLSNFSFLKAHHPILLQLASAAERAFVPDPAITVIKLRQLGEAFAQEIAAACGVYLTRDLTQIDLTRMLIDQQLRQAGWEVDSETLRYDLGARPQPGRDLAIAEWPTASGPADYVLFSGLTPLAVVEAKRKSKDVSGSLDQSRRYSRDYRVKGEDRPAATAAAFLSTVPPHLRAWRHPDGPPHRLVRPRDRGPPPATPSELEAAADTLCHKSALEARRYVEQNPQTFVRLAQAFKLTLDEGVVLSPHADRVLEEQYGYGEGQKPEDYLEAFKAFILAQRNQIDALQVVLTRPRSLTRAQLRSLQLALAEQGYTTAQLQTAWRGMTNADIAAGIIGFIRQQALGSPLVPYGERVDRAMKRVMGMRRWTVPQRQWLERIGKQLKQELVLDREAFELGAFKSKGGYQGVDRILDGQLEQVLDTFSEGIWADGAG